jgi:Pentapeptide repeats (8 copies)
VSNSAIVAAGLVAIVAGGLVIWLVPRLQVARWRRAGIDEEKLAELGTQARSSITQALGGLALIVTLAITAYQANATRRSAEAAQRSADNNLRLAEQGQVSERFSRAIDQLGATNTDKSVAIDVRTGALFSLMQIGLDSPANRQPAFLVVATYVRNNYVPPSQPRPHGCQASFRSLRADISTALTYPLPELAAKLLARAQAPPILGLRGANLDGLAIDGLVLQRFNLTGVKFRDASLNRADFRKARLSGANFDRACLRGTNFRFADLRGSRFTRASLTGADFRGARLTAARFTPDAYHDVSSSLSEAQKRDVLVVSG